MQAGVSTACLYPEAVNGISHVEIFINSESELKKSFIANLAEIMKRYGVTCQSLHPFACPIEPMMLFSRYERRVNDMLDYYRRHFEAMQMLNAKIFVFHGNFKVNAVEQELYCERYLKLVEAGKEFGVVVAQENVDRCQSGSLAFLRYMNRTIGADAQFVVDVKQAVRAGESPLEMLQSLGNHVCHVHISDHGEKGDCLLLGAGNFRIRNFLETLYLYRQNCSVILELYRENFRGISDLVSSYRMLDRMISGICRNVRKI